MRILVRHIIPILSVLIAALVVATTQAFAKELGAVTIEGPGLSAPIQVTDPDIMNLFGNMAESFTASQFVDMASESDSPPRVGEPYRITLFEGNEDGPLTQIYALDYYPNSSGGRGYVHDFYAGGTGKWYRVPTAADTSMRKLLNSHGVKSIPPSFADDPLGRYVWLWLLGLAVLVGGMAVAVLFRVRPSTDRSPQSG